jgi:hypothetical protein
MPEHFPAGKFLRKADKYFGVGALQSIRPWASHCCQASISFSQCYNPLAEFIDPCLGDKVHSGIGLPAM